ncbi:hypothetical protein [Pseudomonas chlororaphis]|uniref:Site-specific integrase n=1 Tax=Pseudomonas chlororaphis O6 TaxID=1037915 RepID=A0AB33WVB3_9PSED|nr:hypothetical protein [Pseudomonas chlororaphis]EIM17074.1 hypothetical protein PchlO6_6052 [Pseudomonas chlororaphis O6]
MWISISKPYIPDLGFPAIAYGTHQAPLDLRILLYSGGAAAERHKVANLIENGFLGPPLLERLELVEKLHDMLTSDLVKGLSPITIINRVYWLRIFYGWCDSQNIQITLATVENSYLLWVESLIHRSRVINDIKEMTAYRHAKGVDHMISKALGLSLGLLRKTRLSAPNKRKRILGTQADKQNLEDLFKFGSLLSDIISALTVDTIKGPLPIEIHIRNGDKLQEWCQQIPLENLKTLREGSRGSQRKSEVKQILSSRAAWEADTSLRTRYPLVNLRIEAELLTFISQTSINLSQAFKLERGNFRYQTDGDEVKVFRVFKGRRSGEADFRIFKEYRTFFKSYLNWVDDLFPKDEKRLFPFVYRAKIPSYIKAPHFSAIVSRCNRLGVRYFKSAALRKTRINWMLRRSQDLDLTAEIAQHTQETLIRVYEEPHHQIAASEISRFHRLTDPSISPPGPGVCIDDRRMPEVIKNMPPGAPLPDCISPAGCLFCDFHRDIEDADYIWSLASYRYCKTLELRRASGSDNIENIHPAEVLIQRITSKLQYFEAINTTFARWVQEASYRIREGHFHPAFDGFIQLMEQRV